MLLVLLHGEDRAAQIAADLRETFLLVTMWALHSRRDSVVLSLPIACTTRRSGGVQYREELKEE